MARLAASLLAAIALAGCATPLTTPSPVAGVVIDGVNAVCDSSPDWPLAPTWAAAIAGAELSQSGFDYVDYHFGSYCPPAASCASSPPNYGYLVAHLHASSSVILIQVSVDASGKVTVVDFQPFSSAPPGL